MYLHSKDNLVAQEAPKVIYKKHGKLDSSCIVKSFQLHSSTITVAHWTA